MEENRLEQYSRVYAKIDLDALQHNMQQMRGNLKDDTKFVAVIKTDAYGHGGLMVARTLENLDYVFGYAVATYEEGLALRNNGIQKPILVLGYTFPYGYEMMAHHDIRPAVFRLDSLDEYNEAAKKQNTRLKVHVKVDTGMGRIGIRPNEEGLDFIEKLLTCDNLEFEGIFTHLARADEYDKSDALRQIQTFQNFVKKVEERFSIQIPIKHCANSAAILEIKEADMDVVRSGITMYGLAPSSCVDIHRLHLKPVLSLCSHIVYIKKVLKGECISYGGTFVAQKDMLVATIPVGYGDGYPRGLSQKGYCLIHGKRASILGRVCMDQFMVDVTEIQEAKEGDLVTLLGKDGEETISAEMLGELSGRFNYELVCDFGKRIPRVYFKDGIIIGEETFF